jgi:hypothetical protein
MINKITKKEYPDIWKYIIDEVEDYCLNHRRGSTFYSCPVYEINEKYFPDNPELYGYWQSEETLYWTDDWGFEDKPSVLVRVESVPVTTYEWKEVEDETNKIPQPSNKATS